MDVWETFCIDILNVKVKVAGHEVLCTRRHEVCLNSTSVSLSKLLEVKEFNKTIIPFALVGYETGDSQLGAIYHRISNVRSWNNC